MVLKVVSVVKCMRMRRVFKKGRISISIIGAVILILFLTNASCNQKSSVEPTPKYSRAIVQVVDSSGNSVKDIKLILKKKVGAKLETASISHSDPSGKVVFKELSKGSYKIYAEGSLVLPDKPLEFSISKIDTLILTYQLEKFTGKLRLINYNVLKGFDHSNKKKTAFINWINKLDPDIICYQELSSYTPEKLQQLANQFDHPYSAMYKIDYFPVAISSKYPITNIQKIAVQGGLGHGCLLVKCLGINIFVLHLNAFSLQKRIDEIKALSTKAKFFPANSYTLFAGDFNSFSKFNADNYGMDWSSVMNEMKPGVEQDFTVTNTLLHLGYKDSYTLFHNTFKRSAPTAINYDHPDKWNGVRYDYVFLSSSLSQYCTFADLWYDETTDKLSDHYPMVVDFEF